MHYERDYLLSHAFLRLHADLLAANTGIYLKVIDLRGSSLLETSDVQDENIIRTCIDGIEDSKPWFVCLQGTRYGYKIDLSNPNLSLKSALNRMMETYGFSEENLSNKSATSIEVEYAFRKLEKKHILFFFRSLIVEGNLLPEIKNLYYSDLDCVAEMRANITNNMTSFANNLHNYVAHLDGTTGMVSHLESLDHMMYDRLCELFANEYGLIRNRNKKGFVKQNDHISSGSLISSSRKPSVISTNFASQILSASKRLNAFIVEGEPGSGKSILAKQLFRRLSKHNYTFLSTYKWEEPYRIIDSIIRDIARRMTETYHREFPYLGESSYSPGFLKIHFDSNHKMVHEQEQDTRSIKLRKHFEEMAQHQPIYLLIDDAHLVKEFFVSEEFNWLFDGSIPRLKVIGFSYPKVFDGTSLNVIPFPLLTSKDAEKLVDFFTVTTGRRMNDSLRNSIVIKALNTRAPIQGIKMIVEYALNMTAIDYFDQRSTIDHNQWMTSQVAKLTFSPTIIWRHLYDRMVYLYGRPAKMILLRIAVTRFGLSQDSLEFIIQKHRLSTIDYYLIRSYLRETMYLLDEDYVWRITNETLMNAVLASADPDELSEARADVLSFYENDWTNVLEYIYQSCILHKELSPKRLKHELETKTRNIENFFRFLVKTVDRNDLNKWTIKNLSVMHSWKTHNDLFQLFRMVIVLLEAKNHDILKVLDSRIEFLISNHSSGHNRFDRLILLLEFMLLRERFPIDESERFDWVKNLYETAKAICDSTQLIPKDYPTQIEVLFEVAYLYANDLANQGSIKKATHVLTHAIEKGTVTYLEIMKENYDSKNTLFYWGDSVFVPDWDEVIFRMDIKVAKLKLLVAFIHWKHNFNRFDRYAPYAISEISFLINNLDKIPEDISNVLETWIQILLNLFREHPDLWDRIKSMTRKILGFLDSGREFVQSLCMYYLFSLCRSVGEHQNHSYIDELLEVFEGYMLSGVLSNSILSVYEDCFRRRLSYIRNSNVENLVGYLSEKTLVFESIMFNYKNIDAYLTMQQIRHHMLEYAPECLRESHLVHVATALRILRDYGTETTAGDELIIVNLREAVLFLQAISKVRGSESLVENVLKRCDEFFQKYIISSIDMLTALISYNAWKHQYFCKVNDRKKDVPIVHLNELMDYVNLQTDFTEYQLIEIITGCDVLYRNAIKTKQWESACKMLFFKGDCLLATSIQTPAYARSLSGRNLKHLRVIQGLNAYLNASTMAFQYDNLGFSLVDFIRLKQIEAGFSTPLKSSYQRIFQSIWKLQKNS